MVMCSDDARFFNHASPANCADCPVEGPDVTAAVRDVLAGEELMWDYGVPSSARDCRSFLAAS